MEMSTIITIITGVVSIGLISYGIFFSKEELNNEVLNDSDKRILSEDPTKILKDLDNIIFRECKRRIDIDMQIQYIKVTSGREISGLSVIVISDKFLDELVKTTSMSILNYMSDSMRNTISLVIKEDEIDSFVITTVYDNLLIASTEMNNISNNIE